MFDFSKTQPNWLISLGKVKTQGSFWHDRDKLAFFGTSSVISFSHSKRYVIVGRTNGGISLDHIANLWEEKGIECLTIIPGFFAFAVWDSQEESLYLCRDGAGGETLYYTIDRSFYIASRLQDLHGFHKKEINLVALRDYLCFAFVPGEQTMWEGVKEVRPGSVLCLPNEDIITYWSAKPRFNKDCKKESLDFYANHLRHSLTEVINEKLTNQQTVGIFLSGGLDSSSVAALSAEIHQRKVVCYSIHFGEDLPNELFFSSLVAQHCGLEHRKLEISFRDMWEFLPETMAMLDDPIGDPLTVPNLLLAKLAKQDASVIFNGEGGDPCFGGPKNQPMLLSQLYSGSAITNYARSFQKCFDDLPQLFKPEIWELVKNKPFFFEADLNSDVEFLEKLFTINIKFKGADHILAKVNNLIGGLGLVGQSPFFDLRIVELSLSMPTEYKVSGAEEKLVLKQAMKDLLPSEIIHRPKSGMMVPVQLGFKKHWNRQAKALLLSKNAAISPYLQTEIIRSWLDYQGDPWKRYGAKLWLLVSLELWLQQHK